MATTAKRTTTRKAAGVNRNAADKALARLDLEADADPLAALVVTLADTLDNGAGSQTANVAREYRVALDRLRELHPGITAPDDFDAFVASLGTPK